MDSATDQDIVNLLTREFSLRINLQRKLIECATVIDHDYSMQVQHEDQRLADETDQTFEDQLFADESDQALLKLSNKKLKTQ